MLASGGLVRPRVCSQKPDLARKRRKPKQALSTEVEIFSRDVSASLRGGSISPGARAALVALIGTLAELLGESPLTT
jgi:hypothetical protein